jgi:hypothetical protein
LDAESRFKTELVASFAFEIRPTLLLNCEFQGFSALRAAAESDFFFCSRSQYRKLAIARDLRRPMERFGVMVRHLNQDKSERLATEKINLQSHSRNASSHVVNSSDFRKLWPSAICRGGKKRLPPSKRDDNTRPIMGGNIAHPASLSSIVGKSADKGGASHVRFKITVPES